MFVDNSNIFLESQKNFLRDLYHHPPYDPRVRVLHEHIVEQILEDKSETPRSLKQVRIYSSTRAVYGAPSAIPGATGPPRKSLEQSLAWKDCLNHGPQFFCTTRRASFSSEKGIDIKISLDILELVRKTAVIKKNPHQQHTLVLLSGDGDFFETLSVALNSGWCVEVWAWKKSVSKEIYSLAQDSKSQMRVRYLNDLNTQMFVFWERVANPRRSQGDTRGVRFFIEGLGFKDMFDREECEALVQQVEKIVGWPVVLAWDAGLQCATLNLCYFYSSKPSRSARRKQRNYQDVVFDRPSLDELQQMCLALFGRTSIYFCQRPLGLSKYVQRGQSSGVWFCPLTLEMTDRLTF